MAVHNPEHFPTQTAVAGSQAPTEISSPVSPRERLAYRPTDLVTDVIVHCCAVKGGFRPKHGVVDDDAMDGRVLVGFLKSRVQPMNLNLSQGRVRPPRSTCKRGSLARAPHQVRGFIRYQAVMCMAPASRPPLV